MEHQPLAALFSEDPYVQLYQFQYQFLKNGFYMIHFTKSFHSAVEAGFNH